MAAGLESVSKYFAFSSQVKIQIVNWKMIFCEYSVYYLLAQMALVVKNLAANAGDVKDAGSIPGLGRSLEDLATHSSILAWRMPCTEEPGGLQSTGSHGVRRD